MNLTSKILAAGLLAGSVSFVNAAPILSVSGEGLAAAQLAESNFLSSLQPGAITEGFDTGYTVGDQATTISSVQGVGSFTSNVAGTGGACDSTVGSINYDCADGLAVLDTASSPFSGRFDVSPDNWLDSMDAREMTFSPTAGFNALGFYMTDPNDAGGRFDIGGTTFDFDDVFGSALGNGKVFYLTMYDDSADLGDVKIFANNPNDGYGIDDVTIGRVPEPGTLALLGLGLAGLGLSRRRKQV